MLPTSLIDSPATPADFLPQHSLIGRQGARLSVSREDLTWFNLTPEVVRLNVTIHNHGDAASRPTIMQINAAEFGAFVQSTPVAQVSVPPIPPRGQVVIAQEFEDPDGRGETGLKRLPRSRMLPRADVEQAPRRRPHSGRPCVWAGNFDVHVRGAKAERHIARPVGLIAGANNVAAFRVGTGADAYRFRFRGEGVKWKPKLDGDFPGSRTLFNIRSAAKDRRALNAGDWVSVKDPTWIAMRVIPPENITEGLLAVAIEQKSSGDEALVEFGFGKDTIPAECFRS